MCGFCKNNLLKSCCVSCFAEVNAYTANCLGHRYTPMSPCEKNSKRILFLRATTYYLADRRYDMLPSVLSADICSLLSGVDR